MTEIILALFAVVLVTIAGGMIAHPTSQGFDLAQKKSAETASMYRDEASDLKYWTKELQK